MDSSPSKTQTNKEKEDLDSMSDQMRDFKKEILDKFIKKRLVMEKIRNNQATKKTDVRFLFKYLEEKRKRGISSDKKASSAHQVRKAKYYKVYESFLIKLKKIKTK